MRTRKSIRSEIDQIKQSNLEGIQEIQKLKQEENRRIQAVRKFEVYKWEQFKEIVKGQPYFRFAHIEELGIKRNFTIHLSAKNTGKTTAIYRKMTEIINKGEKFLYGRVYVNEMFSAMHQFEVDSNCPVVILMKERRWYIYKKQDIQFWKTAKLNEMEEGEEALIGMPKISELKKLGIEPVGLGYTFVNSNTLGGMNYEGYSTIFFDEILSYSPINRINKRVLDAWDASISTITRKKPEINVWFMGNLLDVPEHPILKFYGIDIDDDLRIIKRGENEDCTILFINSGGLYEASFRNQAGVTKHGDVEHQAFLKNNKVLKTTPNILSPRIFEGFNFVSAFAMYLAPDVYFVELRRLPPTKREPAQYCIRCDNLTITTITGGKIYSDNPNIYNKFENTTRRVTILSIFNMVYRLYRSKSLKFDTVSSLEKYAVLLTYYRSKYCYDYAE